MTTVSLRDVTQLLDNRWPPCDPMDNVQRTGMLALLNTVRAIEEDYAVNASPRGHIVRLYCNIIRCLCDVRLTGASQHAATEFDAASHEAITLEMPELSVLAQWYSACCRLMRFCEHKPAQPDDVLLDLTLKLSAVSTLAKRQRNHTLRALSTVLSAYCLQNLSETRRGNVGLKETIEEAQRLLGDATNDMALIRECRRFMALFGAETAAPNDARPDFTLLLYTPGELRKTVR